MKSVIIAAGRGVRLSGISDGIPKPLMPVRGVPLLERIILTCLKREVNQFVIITGYLNNKLEEYFGDGSKLGVSVEYVYNPQWERANGLSALKAREIVESEEEFLLMMSDHLFNTRMLDSILTDVSRSNLLAVDRAVGRIFDLPDATKVLCEGRRIRDIGKEIPQYNGIDCGIFRLKPVFFIAMERAISQGKESLSNGIEELIAMGDFEASFICEGARWLDVDTEAAYKYAEDNIELFEN